ncbi:MAG: hypothetical protein BMS9Abin13_327 [Patescibacteria group bacterium]|nr:MAG: hypothetical protein BMS9Abin13_327 [Patescibacteria group bacterium]
MSIKNITLKIKVFIHEKWEALNVPKEDLFVALLIVLVAFGSFGLGRLSKMGELKEPIRIEMQGASIAGAIQAKNAVLEAPGGNGPDIPDTNNAALTQEGFLVGSKNGTKYHFPWCSGAKRIKEENKVTFQNGEEAQRAGYTPAKNCKGLK